MRIMMLANDTTFIYNLRREILQSFLAHGHEVIIAAQALLFQKELTDMGCRVLNIQTNRHGKNPLSDLRLSCLYRAALTEYKPDLVFTNNIKPNVYGGIACKKLHIPYVANITGLGTAVEQPGALQKLTCRLYRQGVSDAYALLFQNEENERFFTQRNMIGTHTEVIRLPGSGVCLESHPLLPYPEEGVTHFLFIARILKEKGIEQYLDTAYAICRERADVRFHICGLCDDTWYLEKIRKAESDEVVYYHGEQADLRPFMQQAGCLVHPSYYPEGMSNVLLEAASAGRPVITTNRSGCRETVEDGVSGYIVPIQNTEAVISAVRRFLSMSSAERREMGLCGRAKMEREFDRKKVVAVYNDLILRLQNRTPAVQNA